MFVAVGYDKRYSFIFTQNAELTLSYFFIHYANDSNYGHFKI